MKKLTFSIIAFSFLTLSAFAQIPNFSFESWTSAGSYSTPDNWGTMNNTTASLSVYTAQKGTPGNPGTSYLKLTSKTAGPAVINGVAVCGKLDSTTLQPISGFAFNLQPHSFTGKWQFMANSPGSVSVKLTKWNTSTMTEDVIAAANHTLSGMAMSWTNFTINFVYQSSSLPDSCIIVLKASGLSPADGDYLWVDNLAFSGSVTGINNQIDFLNSTVIYPNPSRENITLDLNFKTAAQTTIELADINGKVVLTKNAGVLNGPSKLTIDVSGVAKGSYFVRIIRGNGTEIKKIIVE